MKDAERNANAGRAGRKRIPLRKRLPLDIAFALTRAHAKLISATASGKLAVHDTTQFPWIADFERNWTTIRDEALRLLPAMDMLMNEHDLLGTTLHVDYPNTWKVFVLTGAMEQVPENCRRCPTTARLCDSVPGVIHAFFSIMKAGAHIKPHRAYYNGRLRYHLALKVPSPSASSRLRVDTHTLAWAEGESLVFDDTFEHEAWNDGKEDRVVLILDFLRPLPPPFYSMNSAFMRGMMRLIASRGRRNVEAWEKTHGRDLDDLLRPTA